MSVHKATEKGDHTNIKWKDCSVAGVGSIYRRKKRTKRCSTP